MNTRLFFCTGLLLTALTGCSSGGDSTTDKGGSAGDGQRVNTFTQGDQQTPGVARNKAGFEVIVWDSEGGNEKATDGTAGTLSGIFAQRYLNGVPVGAEFQVNQYIENRQNLPAVAMDSAGNFVVVWRSSAENGDKVNTAEGSGHDGGTIFGRLYKADGTPKGDEFVIGPDNSNFDSQTDPAVAMNDSGQFVAVFSNRELSAIQAELNLINLGETREVQAHVFNADGSSVGGIISVSSSTSSIERTPGVGVAADGSFVVCWISDGVPSTIDARLYSATGSALADKFLVSDEVSASDRPVMAMNAAGKFVIAWERAVDQPLLTGIYAAAYNADGSAIRSQFQIAPRAVAYERPAIGIDDSGRFAIAAQAAQTRGGNAINVVIFNPTATTGTAYGPLNATTFGMFPRAAVDGNGNGSLVWHTYAKNASSRDVYHAERNLSNF